MTDTQASDVQTSDVRPSDARPVAIVTGGSRGIGAQVARRLHHDGFAVLITHSSSPQEAAALVRELDGDGRTAQALQQDVTAPGAAGQAWDVASALGDVVALVNNAGVTRPMSPLAELSDEHLDAVLAVNVAAPVRWCREAARRWAGTDAPPGRRRIVNLSSIAARTGSPGEYVEYAGSKAFVEALTVGLARELGPSGVLVNAVAPGIVETTIHARSGEPGRPARLAERIPLRRPGRADEVAAAVAWLLSPESTYTTGTVLAVGGGL